MLTAGRLVETPTFKEASYQLERILEVRCQAGRPYALCTCRRNLRLQAIPSTDSHEMKSALPDSDFDMHDLEITDEELDEFLSHMERETRAAHVPNNLSFPDGRPASVSETTSASSSGVSGSVSAGPSVVAMPTQPADLECNDSVTRQLQEFNVTNARASFEHSFAVGSISATAPLAARGSHTGGTVHAYCGAGENCTCLNTSARGSFSAVGARAADMASMDHTSRQLTIGSSHSNVTAVHADARMSWAMSVPQAPGSNNLQLESLAESLSAFQAANSFMAEASEQRCSHNAFLTEQSIQAGYVAQQTHANWQLQTAGSVTGPSPTRTIAGISTPSGGSPIGSQAQMSAAALPSVASVLAAARAPADSTAPALPTGQAALDPARTLPTLPAPTSAVAQLPSADSRDLPSHPAPTTPECRGNADQLQRFEDLVMQMFLQQRGPVKQEGPEPQQLQQPQQQQSGPSGAYYDRHSFDSCAPAPSTLEGSALQHDSFNQFQDASNSQDDVSAGQGLRRMFSLTTPSSKGQPSHSIIEKQRRDRLNGLIEQLAALVPPADPRYERAASSRRPKHVVLSDTINLIKAMQRKLQMDQQAALDNSELAPAGMVGANGLTADSPPVLQGMPLREVHSGGVPETGVIVQYAGHGTMLLNVLSRDQPGSLLADVMIALKAIPVTILSMNATRQDGSTTSHIIEVHADDRAVTAQYIQRVVQEALAVQDKPSPRSKRLRQFDWE